MDILSFLKKKLQDIQSAISDDQGFIRQGRPTLEPIREAISSWAQANPQKAQALLTWEPVFHPIETAKQSLQQQGITSVPQFFETVATKARESFKPFVSQVSQKAYSPIIGKTGADLISNVVGGYGQAMLAGPTGLMQRKPLVEKLGDIASTIGATAYAPETIGFGAMSPLFTTAGKLITQRKLPTGEELTKSVGEGIEFGAKLGPISEAAGKVLKPILSRLNPTGMQSWNTYIQLARNPVISKEAKDKAWKMFWGAVVKQLGEKAIRGFVGMGAYGATMPAKSTEERLRNIIEQGLTGALFETGQRALGQGLEIGYKQGIKPAIEWYKGLTPQERQAGFVRIKPPEPLGKYPQVGEEVIAKFNPETEQGKKLIEKYGEQVKVKIVSKPFRVPSGAVLVKGEIEGKQVNLPISKHLEWLKPTEEAISEVKPTIKIKAQATPIEPKEEDLLRRFANFENISGEERKKLEEIVTQKLRIPSEQWANESGVGKRRLVQQALGMIKSKETTPPLSPIGEVSGGGEGGIGSSQAPETVPQPNEEDLFLKSLEEGQKAKAEQPNLTELKADKTAQYEASIKGGDFTGKLDPEVKQRFADWVNQRRATKVEALLKKKEFSDLDKLGIDGILQFQKQEPTGRLADVKNYFDTKYNQIKDTGIDLRYKKFYLPQLWENSPEEVQQAIGRKLGLKPSFSLQSVIQNYEEGIKAGLTPRFKNLSDLVAWYERTANKAIADKAFFDYLAKEGFIQPEGKAPMGWKVLKNFPKISVSIPGEAKYTGNYSAPAPLADMINNYLSTPEIGDTASQIFAKIANYVSSAKNRLLSFGIPGTGINAHGFNILARSFLEGGPGGALKTAYYMINPKAAEKFIENNLKLAPEAIKSGLTFSTSEAASALEDSGAGVVEQFGKKWNDLFEKPLFDKIIGAKKIEAWNNLWREYAKSMPEDQAKREAAKFVNNIYGGINWEELGRSRDLQNIFRILALTPDWLESNLRLGGGIIKSFLSPTNPAGKAYRRAATYLIASYVMFNLINKLTSGHNLWENDPGHTFEIEAGYTADGQKRYIRPFGTAVDFVRIPIDIAIGLIKGDPTPLFRAIGNRLSVLASPIIHLIGNTNWAGQPIYGKTKYGVKMTPLQSAAGIAGELSTALGVPSFLGEGLRYITGQQGLEQTLTQGFELPFRYAGGAYSAAQKQIKPFIEGASGKEKYDIYQMLKGQRKFSENQLGLIKQGGLQDILNKRKEAELDNQAKEKLSQSSSDVLQANNKIYIKEDNGKIKVIDPLFQPKEPTLTGNSELDKKLVEKYKRQITKKTNDIVTLYEKGLISKDEAEKMLQDLKIKVDKVNTKIGKGKKIKIGKPPALRVSGGVRIPKIRISTGGISRGYRLKPPTIKIAKRKPTNYTELAKKILLLTK